MHLACNARVGDGVEEVIMCGAVLEEERRRRRRREAEIIHIIPCDCKWRCCRQGEMPDGRGGRGGWAFRLSVVCVHAFACKCLERLCLRASVPTFHVFRESAKTIMPMTTRSGERKRERERERELY